ncbi:hypothetical protein NPX13_g7268 [Xylaria arbuscula]|uniref:Uncharacterized protein n=1 Tax=Xylaria arbuscula TaxID=114810 RepID=A0A9W8NAB5_9PEZI|nr:hypothetical protein NPX13_g7268 [Xylaria arbuscula]
MSANTYTSSEESSDGGAPLYQAFATPVPTLTRRHGEANLKTPSEEEKALVRASENFGNLKDPFSAETPGVPQSIQPGTYLHRANYPQPTPSRAHNGFSRFGNSQSAGRYRSSTAGLSGPSSSVPRFRPAVGNTAFNNPQLADDLGITSPQQVFSSIMMATQYVNVTPGLPTPCQAHLNQILQDISQGFTTVTTQLRKQCDNASRSREEEHERFKRATHELEQLQKVVDELKLAKNTLETQLSHSTESQGLLKDHIKDLQAQQAAFQKQLDTLTADALRFHEHHDRIVEDYKVQDEKHFKAMTQLENEVKVLRTVSNVSHEDIFSTPKHPESVNNVTGECTTNSPVSVKKQSPAHDTTLLNSLHESAEPKKDGFVPNPQAPSFAPATARTEAVTDNVADKVIDNTNSSSHSSGTSVEPRSESSSGNSGEVILYTGNGGNSGNANQSRALAAYVGPPAPGAGGAPTYFRTPFGIVFGEYPTVEENGRLPGDKFIPREKLEWNEIDVQRALAHLYDLCKGYCANCHIRGPPNVPYDRLPEQESYTWHYLMQQVYKDPEHAASHLAYLLSTKTFAPYILQRTCVDYLLKKLLTPQVFIGFSEQMDAHLRALQGQLANIAAATVVPTTATASASSKITQRSSGPSPPRRKSPSSAAGR